MRSSSSTLLRSFAISWSLLILGLPLPGEALPPISLRSQDHLLSVESLMPGSSESSRAVILSERIAFAAEILMPFVAFSLLGRFEYLSPLTWCPIYLTCFIQIVMIWDGFSSASPYVEFYRSEYSFDA